MSNVEGSSDPANGREGGAKRTLSWDRGELTEILIGISRLAKRDLYRSIVITLISIAIGGVWILYSLRVVRKLEEQKQTSQKELDKVQLDLSTAKDILRSVKMVTGMSDDELRSYPEQARLIVEQGKEADHELSQIVSNRDDKVRRKGLTIKYFPKRKDPPKLPETLEDLKARGFGVVVWDKQTGEPDTRTNALWLISPNVAAEDVRIVAYNLIRAGVQLRYIGRYPYPSHLRGAREKLWIGGDRNYEKLPSLTAEQIKHTEKF